jgi:signal transduction histidine kinase
MLELFLYMQTERNIVLTVVLITCIFLLTAAFLVLYVRLYTERKRKHIEEKKLMVQDFEQQLLQSRLETREETFNHLGKELHDNVGQLLNSTKLLIGVAQRTHALDTLTLADDTLGKAINELRSLSKSLDNGWLEQFNFIENLETEIMRINATDSLRVYFAGPHELLLQPDAQIILFRIVQEALQEALQNIIKHAHAKEIHIAIQQSAGLLHISIADDGVGFSKPASAKGAGILNIRHRTRLLGGTVEWQSPAKGTIVYIRLPLKQKEI